MSDYGKILMSTANAVGASLKKKMGSLTGFAPVDWAETINKLGNKLPERTVSGAVCTFSDGADDVPMPSVKASITAVQAGSGDPSPSNVREISGFAECDVTHTKKNLFDAEKIVKDSAHTSYVYIQDGYLRFTTGNLAIKNFLFDNLKFPCPLTFKGKLKSFSSGNNIVRCRVVYLDGTTDSITLGTLQEQGELDFSTTIGTSGKTVFRINGNWTDDKAAGFDLSETQLEIGSTATDYESYAGETIPVWMGGKNLLDPDAISEIVINSNNDKRYGITVTKAGTYTLSCTSRPANHYFYVRVKASDGTYGTGEMINATTPRTKTIVSGETLLVYNAGTGFTKAQQSALIRESQTMLELGDTATAYEPCRYIYGGELNFTTGVLTVTHGYIASYDGETINEPWISSIDKYVAGNSPSTGAQVVYPLTTPTTIQLTPEEVRSFLGTNNLWANTGDSECTYFAQPNVPEEVLYKGQISSTSGYATANFTGSVADDEEILVKVYCPARSAVDYKVIKVSDIGNGLNVGFNLHTTVNCTITKTSIASYQYSGDYYDIYADVLAYDSSIFN